LTGSGQEAGLWQSTRQYLDSRDRVGVTGEPGGPLQQQHQTTDCTETHGRGRNGRIRHTKKAPAPNSIPSTLKPLLFWGCRAGRRARGRACRRDRSAGSCLFRAFPCSALTRLGSLLLRIAAVWCSGSLQPVAPGR
jgi:hypothetical protein